MDSEAEKQIDRILEGSAYQRGRSAFYRGDPKSPYPAFTLLGTEWQAGFDDEKVSFANDPVILEALERNG